MSEGFAVVDVALMSVFVHPKMSLVDIDGTATMVLSGQYEQSTSQDDH